MSYKAGIIKAITELKERTGSSSIAIKKHMQVRFIFACPHCIECSFELQHLIFHSQTIHK